MDFTSKTEEIDILSGLKSGNPRDRSAAIRRLCTAEWVGLARKAVQSAGGREADVEDVFQESLAAMVKNVMYGHFLENSKLSTYFFEICRRRCLKAYRSKEYLEISEQVTGDTAPSLENLLMDREAREEKIKIVNLVLGRLGEPCASILKFRKLEYSYEEIGEELDRSPDTVKNQAARCRKRMREMIESDPVLYDKIRKGS